MIRRSIYEFQHFSRLRSAQAPVFRRRVTDLFLEGLAEVADVGETRPVTDLGHAQHRIPKKCRGHGHAKARQIPVDRLPRTLAKLRQQGRAVRVKMRRELIDRDLAVKIHLQIVDDIRDQRRACV